MIEEAHLTVAALPDLEVLELNRVASVDLEPLTCLKLSLLRIWPGSGANSAASERSGLASAV